MNASETVPATGTTVLVVEDEGLIAEEIAERLAKLSYRIAGKVDSGEAAIARARELRPDVVLMDILLKGLVDGIEAAEVIHRELLIPVVYLTAHSDVATLRRAKASAPFGYVVKPFHERELFAAIEMGLQRSAVEQRLRESEARQSATLRSIGDGVIATDTDGKVTFMNPTAESITGWPLTEARGQSIERIVTLVSEEDRAPIENPLTTALERQESVRRTGAILLLDRDGREVHFEDSAAPILDRTGLLSGAVMAFRDAGESRRMTRDLQRARQRLAEAEKLEAIGKLAGFVAHDFNNLVTVVRGNAELLALEEAVTPPQGQALRAILAACERATAMTTRLMAASRHQVLDPRVVDLNEVVLGLRDLLDRMIGGDVSLDVRPAATPCPVLVDPAEVEQVVLNLAANARDAMPDGGTLRIDLGTCEVGPRETGEPVPAGRYVRLLVSDTGVGMTPETRRRLFEPYYTAKIAGGGTGLGLASVHGTVAQLGGHVSVASAPGCGSIFSIYLPRQPVDQLKPLAPRPAPPRRSEGVVGRILLVEDDDEVRAVSRRALEREGHRVLEAPNAARALELAGAEPIDLLIADVVLPGTGGRQLAEKLRFARAQLPVLFVSGYTTESRLAPLPAGCRLLRKPYSPDALSAEVGNLLALARESG